MRQLRIAARTQTQERSGVLKVDVNYRKGVAMITANKDALPSSEEVEDVIRKAGYGIGDEPASNEACPVMQNGILDVCIDGMTSKDSEHIIKKRLKHVAGVKSASIQYQRGTAKIHFSQMPDWDDLRDAVENAGYHLRRPDEAPSVIELSHNKWIEIGGSLLIIFAIYKLLLAFDLVSLAPSTSGALSLGGSLSSASSPERAAVLPSPAACFFALAAKHNELHQAETSWEKFKPLLHFNLGRLVSCFVLGGVVESSVNL